MTVSVLRPSLAGLLIVCLLGGCARQGGKAAGPPPGGATAVAGCSLGPTGGLKTRTLLGAGQGSPVQSRSYQLYVPRGVDAQSRLPLLVSLHGLGANGSIQNAATHWSSFDDAQAARGSGFLLALPNGFRDLWYWGSEDSYDVRFLFQVIAQLEKSGCVDRTRIYVDGWSEGAYMAQRMACASGDPNVDPQGIAVAAVHAYAGGDPVVFGPCAAQASSAPPRILISQGLDDLLIDPQEVAFPAFQAWGVRYSCVPVAAPFTTAQELSGCRNGTRVDWWPIRGFTHLTWSCLGDTYWHHRGVWAFLTKGVAPTDPTCP
ncbi:MAG: hypothetical protein J2P45_05505 [Candidatus Dormibacteraeota bacterium]|nr:hypothetical protein [Candidatus Dormibacteraeota bacterium]